MIWIVFMIICKWKNQQETKSYLLYDLTEAISCFVSIYWYWGKLGMQVASVVLLQADPCNCLHSWFLNEPWASKIRILYVPFTYFHTEPSRPVLYNSAHSSLFPKHTTAVLKFYHAQCNPPYLLAISWFHLRLLLSFIYLFPLSIHLPGWKLPVYFP